MKSWLWFLVLGMSTTLVWGEPTAVDTPTSSTAATATSSTATPGTVPAAAVVVTSPHYRITSWAGVTAGQNAADLLETLWARYAAVLQMPPPAGKVFNVVLWPDQASYEKAIGPLVGSADSDFVALSYTDPTKNVLEAWNAPDKESSWSFQAFLQWFWAIDPAPPAWIETGLAYYFWDIGGQSPNWQFGNHRVFADDVLNAWGDHGPDLGPLLGENLPKGKEKDAWALVSFLMNTSDPTYARAFGAILADLSSPAGTSADQKTNTALALTRLSSVKPLDQIATDCLNWWKAHPGFSRLLQEAEDNLRAQKGQDARPLLDEALKLRPHDGPVVYLAGLASYEAQDWTNAEETYQKAIVDWKDAPAGLLEYALGLTSFQAKNWPLARQRLEAAAKADPSTYGPLTKPLLANLP